MLLDAPSCHQRRGSEDNNGISVILSPNAQQKAGLTSSWGATTSGLDTSIIDEELAHQLDIP